MKTVVGIFQSREQAQAAASRLHEAGFAAEGVNLLTPSASEAQIHSGIPTTETEQPGMGKAVGGVVGGAAGAAAGMGLATAAASLLVPGVGAVTAIGLAAAAHSPRRWASTIYREGLPWLTRLLNVRRFCPLPR